jgi:hypothetical protein
MIPSSLRASLAREEIALKAKRTFALQDENPLYSRGFLDRGG